MRKQIGMVGMLTAGCLLGGSRLLAADVGTAFSYQGRLVKNAAPVTSDPPHCDFTFGLWDAAVGGSQKGNSPQSLLGVEVTRGLFTVNIDFGPAGINGTARWLEITVDCPGDAMSTTLTPRQELKPASHALALPGLYIQQNATSPNVIGGFSGNSVTGGVFGSTIAGGGRTDDEFVNNNRVTADWGTVGGGYGNTSSFRCTVGGGIANSGSADLSTVGGGGDEGVGQGNWASGDWSTVGGGDLNIASGSFGTIPGRRNNQAGGSDSFAAGQRAKVHTPAQVGGGDTDGDQGTFVWADSTFADFTSDGPNKFLVRASGGTTFYSNAALTAGVTLAAGGGSWSSVSDRNLKENVAEVDARDILERLARVPVTTWNYKSQDDSIRHMGPMEQDFHAAFGVGEEETRISTTDADGVALAAIQGLHAIVQEKECEISDLKLQNSELEKKNLNHRAQFVAAPGSESPRRLKSAARRWRGIAHGDLELETRLTRIEQLIGVGQARANGGER